MGQIAVKREVWKKMQKTSKKRSAGHARKTVLGAVGPLKNKKTRHQNIKTRHQIIRKQGRWIKHALACLKARWRIYYELMIS